MPGQHNDNVSIWVATAGLILAAILLVTISLPGQNGQGDLYNAVGNYCGDGVVWQWDFAREKIDDYAVKLPAVCHREAGDLPIWVNLKTLEVGPR